jgi:hypothetical protein
MTATSHVETLGTLQQVQGQALIPDAAWYEAEAAGDGVRWAVPAGAMTPQSWLIADMLLDSAMLAVFELRLYESGRTREPFRLTFGLQPQCGARLRLLLTHVALNRWMLPREGAWLKPLCGGHPVQPELVTSIELRVLRKAHEPVRWCMTPLRIESGEPPWLDNPVLPRGPLLDELGQSTLHDWPGRTRDARELADRLSLQLTDGHFRQWPGDWSRWGGWTAQRFDATGWFRTQHDGRRWWLVDPDGCAFWSTGCDCVNSMIDTNIRGLRTALTGPPPGTGERADYLQHNLSRVLGDDWRDRWAGLALASLRDFGFNTIGNWSQTAIARGRFPYVTPIPEGRWRTPCVFRDFPDVFDPRFEQDARDFAQPLRDTADDPAMIGYFLMNEPTWGFAEQTPAEGMLLNTDDCHCRDAMATHLRQQYRDDAALALAWGEGVTFDRVARGRWPALDLGVQARADLAAFSTVMVRRLFDTLSQACRQVDPHHMNLGARYYKVPPDWALAGMTSFDCFSINGYGERINHAGVASIAAAAGRPVMIGEFHFGALDAGLPASGIGHVPDQAARGAAYRMYIEDAAADPNCVGAHWFTLYDQSALGRFDGENYNIGFMDVCHRPYAELVEAARLTHERLYAVAAGQAPPFAEAPRYLPMLFM